MTKMLLLSTEKFLILDKPSTFAAVFNGIISI